MKLATARGGFISARIILFLTSLPSLTGILEVIITSGSLVKSITIWVIKTESIFWIIQLGYGFVASQGEQSRKTEDYINLMTNYGYDIGKIIISPLVFSFYHSFLPVIILLPNTEPHFCRPHFSRFMSPGYLNAGLGISYNPNEISSHFRPINGKFTVADPYLQKKENDLEIFIGVIEIPKPAFLNNAGIYKTKCGLKNGSIFAEKL